ncbi:MAG: hypothetical protein KME11_22550 [Timaviella obliquedivisa GSE-PSE-MK23-08B]|jgi:hypothetical protein|nr:hypothetical protein [Timaviella obliquedivisa GSE-PSE-MK23-08B]
METEQLELDLWNALEKARQFPETMNVLLLCDALEHAIVDQPLAEQLRVVAEGIEQLVGVYAERADYLIDGYERRHNPQEPIVNLENCVELFVQSLQLDVSELMEPEEEVQYPVQRRSRVREEEMGSVVGVLDQAALLAQLDQRLSEEPGMTETERLIGRPLRYLRNSARQPMIRMYRLGQGRSDEGYKQWGERR